MEIKKILVPTDFSKASEAALAFAQGIAQGSGAEIMVLHAYHPPMEAAPAFPLGKAEWLQVTKNRLRAFAESQGGGAEIARRIQTEIAIGFPVDEIVRAARDWNATLIVMGAGSAFNLARAILGSTSALVCEKAECPVLLVPEEASFQGLDHILYASQFNLADSVVLQELQKFARPFQGNIHIVHVQTEDSKGQGPKAFDQVRQHQRIAFPAYNMETVEGDSVVEGLNSYVEKHDIKLLVVATRHRSFWERLLRKSTTKKMALHARVPTLVIHFEDV